MSKNGIIAALWTAAIIGGVWGIIYSIENYPQFMGYILAVGLVGFVCVVFVYPLWDTIKYELDKRDRDKQSIVPNISPSVTPKNAKEMMITKKDDFFNIEFDEDDKAQIG